MFYEQLNKNKNETYKIFKIEKNKKSKKIF